MKELLGLLQYVEASTEALAIAKGLHFLPQSLSELHRRNKKITRYVQKELHDKIEANGS